jgi:hypothetical protein
LETKYHFSTDFLRDTYYKIHILGEMASIQKLSFDFRKILTPLCIGLLQIAKVVELAKNRKIVELSSFEGAEQPLYITYRTLQLVDILSE